MYDPPKRIHPFPIMAIDHPNHGLSVDSVAVVARDKGCNTVSRYLLASLYVFVFYSSARSIRTWDRKGRGQDPFVSSKEEERNNHVALVSLLPLSFLFSPVSFFPTVPLPLRHLLCSPISLPLSSSRVCGLLFMYYVVLCLLADWLSYWLHSSIGPPRAFRITSCVHFPCSSRG